MNNEKPDDSTLEPNKPHIIATGLGAAGGGIVGASIGKSIAGKFGAVVGGVAGAIAGSVTGDALADLAIETNESLGLGLGANDKDIELPAHYSWDELQALSKPQGQSS